MPSGSSSLSDADFDKLSADYILHCVKSATKKYKAESTQPIMIHSKLGDSYFLTSDPDLAGSPPRRVPPSTIASRTSKHASSLSSQLDSFKVKSVEMSGDDYGSKHKAETAVARAPLGNSGIPSVGLPTLKTGFLKDSLMMTCGNQHISYCLHLCFFSGVEMFSVEDRKKEKISKFLSRLKSKRGKPHSQPQLSERQSELIDTIRAQMQISEAMDGCMHSAKYGTAGCKKNIWQIDLPQISLELLIGIFRSDFLSEKSYIQWKCRQVNILEELIYFSAELPETERLTMKSCLAKIRDTKEWDVATSPAQRVERKADAIPSLIELTWSTLGISHKLRSALYGWVLVQQFVGTDEGTLLEHAVIQLQRVASAEEDD